MNVQANYCNNNLLILDLKQLNQIMKLYFHTLKALWEGHGKIKMYYGMSRVKKQLSGKRSIKPLSKFRNLFQTMQVPKDSLLNVINCTFNGECISF